MRMTTATGSTAAVSSVALANRLMFVREAADLVVSDSRDLHEQNERLQAQIKELTAQINEEQARARALTADHDAVVKSHRETEIQLAKAQNEARARARELAEARALVETREERVRDLERQVEEARDAQAESGGAPGEVLSQAVEAAVAEAVATTTTSITEEVNATWAREVAALQAENRSHTVQLRQLQGQLEHKKKDEMGAMAAFSALQSRHLEAERVWRTQAEQFAATRAAEEAKEAQHAAYATAWGRERESLRAEIATLEARIAGLATTGAVEATTHGGAEVGTPGTDMERDGHGDDMAELLACLGLEGAKVAALAERLEAHGEDATALLWSVEREMGFVEGEDGDDHGHGHGHEGDQVGVGVHRSSTSPSCPGFDTEALEGNALPVYEEEEEEEEVVVEEVVGVVAAGPEEDLLMSTPDPRGSRPTPHVEPAHLLPFTTPSTVPHGISAGAGDSHGSGGGGESISGGVGHPYRPAGIHPLRVPTTPPSVQSSAPTSAASSAATRTTRDHQSPLGGNIDPRAIDIDIDTNGDRKSVV